VPLTVLDSPYAETITSLVSQDSEELARPIAREVYSNRYSKAVWTAAHRGGRQGTS